MTSDKQSLGFHDLLPPHADHEAHIAEQIMRQFHLAGYERIKPPLAEQEQAYETIPSLQRMRFINPSSEEIMWLRHDITPQIMRIARTKLAKRPRPLRLSYCGECLTTQTSQLHPSRQYLQAGMEIFGSEPILAESEVIMNGVDALRSLSKQRLTLDLNLPSLTEGLFNHFDLKQKERLTLRSVLNHKDLSSLENRKSPLANIFIDILKASGPAQKSLAQIEKIKLPREIHPARDQLLTLVHHLQKEDKHLFITLDPLDNRGLVSYIGITFSLFMEGHNSEIGRGGRYQAHSSQIPQRLFARHHQEDHHHLYPHQKTPNAKQGQSIKKNEQGEEAVGMTLFIDALAQAIPHEDAVKKIFAHLTVPRTIIQQHRQKGDIVICALEQHKDPHNHARTLRCTHVFDDKTHKIKKIDDE